MKKLLLGALLLLSALSFAQTPKYLTENEIQFSIKYKEGVWYKFDFKDGRIGYIYDLNTRNENLDKFMYELDKVKTFYGVEYFREIENIDNSALHKYDENIPYPALCSIDFYERLNDEEKRQLVYSYLVGDKKTLCSQTIDDKTEFILALDAKSLRCYFLIGSKKK